ncbi:MAG: ribosome-binding factor [Myxococcales bacterium]|nr:ribosome-binding factor [Myxococcales bacterium]
MSQRTERVAGEVRAIIGELLARQEIKDPRVQKAGIITVTHVRITGDLRQARALFTVHNAGAAELDHVREGLDHASGYFRHAIARRLRLKVTPALSFEVDQVFEKATRIEHLLQEIAAEAPAAAPSAEADAQGAADADAEVDQAASESADDDRDR